MSERSGSGFICLLFAIFVIFFFLKTQQNPPPSIYTWLPWDQRNFSYYEGRNQTEYESLRAYYFDGYNLDISTWIGFVHSEKYLTYEEACQDMCLDWNSSNVS